MVCIKYIFCIIYDPYSSIFRCFMVVVCVYITCTEETKPPVVLYHRSRLNLSIRARTNSNFETIWK